MINIDSFCSDFLKENEEYILGAFVERPRPNGSGFISLIKILIRNKINALIKEVKSKEEFSNVCYNSMLELFRETYESSDFQDKEFVINISIKFKEYAYGKY